MKSPNRLLLGLGLAIAALAIIAIGLVLFIPKTVSLLPEDTPEGTVQRFLLAVQEKDYPKAFTYLNLVEAGKTVTYSDWVRDIPAPFTSTQSSWKATLGRSTVSGNNASVEVLIDTFRPNGPFGSSTYTQQFNFQLTKTGNSWFITSRPPLYWLY
ncbi:MAG: hypothetical protein ABIH70_05095 [Chloroflexota bacterium]